MEFSTSGTNMHDGRMFITGVHEGSSALMYT